MSSDLSQYPNERRFLSMESIFIGGIMGFLLTILSLNQVINNVHLFHSPIEETLYTAIALIVIIAYAAFDLPIPFASKPRLAIFIAVVIIGLLSMFADSFALILIFAGVTMQPYAGEAHFRFNAFAVKVLAALSALTVGAAFSIGELYALPHYIATGMGDFIGLPMLVVLLPFAMILGLIAAIFFPVRFDVKPWDRSQTIAAVKLVVLLGIIIVTHNPFLPLGIVLLMTALTGRTTYVLSRIYHEVEEGGATALALIMGVILLEANFPEFVHSIQHDMSGIGTIALAALSSPFAGALLPGAETIEQFYLNISHLMLGAPLLVSSSLVAIIVFRNTIHFNDLPPILQRVPGIRYGAVYQEAVAYTALAVPCLALLAFMLHIGNSGLFMQVYHLIF